MASPFHVFRKHQKILIATLGLLAMIAFVFLPMILQSGPSKATKKNPVVVTTEKYGDLHEDEIERMQNKRKFLLDFLRAVIQEAAPGDQMFQYYQTQIYITPLMLGDFGEKFTVNHWLMVQRAREMGMVVSDDTINKFLNDLTDNRFSGQDFSNIFKRFNTHENFVFSALQDELLASNLMQMFTAGLRRGTTPAERWNYFQRLKRRVDLEVVPLDVAAFVDDKSDPGDKELKKYFEKYKDRYPVEHLPDPGFKVTPTVAIEYIKAEYDKFADPALVTDEEIEAYYMENRENYRNVQLPGLDLDEPEPSTTTPESDEKTQKAESETADQKTTPSVEAESPKKDEKTATDEPQAEPSEKQPAKEASDQTNEIPNEKPSEKTNDKLDDKPGENTSDATVRSPFRFVSMTDTDEKEVQKEEKKEEPAEATDKKTPLPTESPENATKAAPKSVIELPSLPVDESDAAKKPSGDEPKEVPTVIEPAKPKPEYKPLEEVKDEIRKILSQKKVRERILNGFQPIRTNMSKYHKKLIKHEASKDEDGNASIPAPTIELELLANPAEGSHWVKKGWKLIDSEQAKSHQPNEIVAADNFGPLVKTGLVTVEELRPFSIAFSRTEGNQIFLRDAFSSMPLHLPGISWDSEGNVYLYWKTEEVEARVPEFKEVRDKVLKAWQYNEARKAAMERGETLAKQAREAGISLKDSIGKEAGIDVYETGEFTWITTDTLTTRPSLRMSSVKHVDLAGSEFMRTAYGLELGQVGVALNQPETTVYVMRLVKTSPLESVLMASFEVEDYMKYAAIGDYDNQKLFGDWIKTLEKDAGLDWKRPAKPAPAQQR